MANEDVPNQNTEQSAGRKKGGPSYAEVTAELAVQRLRAEVAEERINKAKIVIGNPFHRYGPYVDAKVVGTALGMERIWHA